MMNAGYDESPACIYRYSSGIGISVSLLAAHIAGWSSGRASILAILTSEHYLRISIGKLYYLEGGETDIVFHLPRTRIPRFKIHDTHLADLCLK